MFNITILCGGDMSESVTLRNKSYKLWFIAKSELKNHWKVPGLGNTDISFSGKKNVSTRYLMSMKSQQWDSSGEWISS